MKQETIAYIVREKRHMENSNQLRALAILDDIRELLHDEQDNIRHRYDRLYVAFIEVLNEQTAASALTFSGPFSKLDYVCRVMGYPMADLQRLNAFRCRASQTDSCDEATLTQEWKYDVKTVCHFVTKVYGIQLPEDLRRLLPAAYSPQPFKGVSEDCIRAVVRASTVTPSADAISDTTSASRAGHARKEDG